MPRYTSSLSHKGDTMIKVDKSKQLIEMTRGDSANIVFSAAYPDDTPEVPHKYVAQTGDRLKFSIGKKYGSWLTEIVNEKTSGMTEDEFWTIAILPEHTSELKFRDYYFDVQLEVYDSNADTYDIVTIIGQTDDIAPTIRLWGEVSE